MTAVSRVLRYGAVGLVGASVHFGVLVALVRVGVHPVLSSSIGFCVTVLVSYVLNYYWTFRSQGPHKRSFPRYIVITVGGLILNATVMFVTVEVLHWNYLLGQTCAVALIPVSNFILSWVWAFRPT